jgi:NAD-dependent deacetylase
MKKKLVVLTGAGMSADSGIPTFRGSDGLWENHRIEDVASPEGWRKNRTLVLEFYNQRRKRIYEVEPNRGHYILADLEKDFDVHIITQNIDNLHERAGSTNVLHLHGEITKARSTANSELIYELKHWELKEGDVCELGSQLRPHIVWFGEAVPMIEPAALITQQADIVVVVGTSLQVYPAAGLIQYASDIAQKFIIDPYMPAISGISNITKIEKGASEGLEELKQVLMQ